jgi:hypothetical protein
MNHYLFFKGHSAGHFGFWAQKCRFSQSGLQITTKIVSLFPLFRPRRISLWLREMNK